MPSNVKSGQSCAVNNLAYFKLRSSGCDAVKLLHSENEGSKFLTQHLCPTTTLHIITAQKIDLNPHHCENLKSSVV